MKKKNCTETYFTSDALNSTPETGTMKLDTQNNAVESLTAGLERPAAKTYVYTVEEVAQMLAISLRSAYNLCNTTNDFRVLRVGGSIRIPKDSFHPWLFRAA